MVIKAGLPLATFFIHMQHKHVTVFLQRMLHVAPCKMDFPSTIKCCQFLFTNDFFCHIILQKSKTYFSTYVAYICCGCGPGENYTATCNFLQSNIKMLKNNL